MLICNSCGHHRPDGESICPRCHNPSAHYMPEPEVISAACQEIQEGWSQRIRATRMGETARPYEVPQAILYPRGGRFTKGIQ